MSERMTAAECREMRAQYLNGRTWLEDDPAVRDYALGIEKIK
jgi:hypothetical protein